MRDPIQKQILCLYICMSKFFEGYVSVFTKIEAFVEHWLGNFLILFWCKNVFCSIWVLPLLLLNFMSGFKLKLMYYTFHQKDVKPHSTPQLSLHVMLSLLREITSFICANRLDLLYLRPGSDRSVILVKVFLNLTNLKS